MSSWTYDTWVALSIVVSIAKFLWGNALTSQRLVPNLDTRLVRVRYIVVRRHLQHIRDDRRMGNHDRLRPPRRPTRERQERDLRLRLARLHAMLDKRERLREALVDELCDGAQAGARRRVVHHDDLLGPQADTPSGFEAGLDARRVHDEELRLDQVQLVLQLVCGVRWIRPTSCAIVS